MRLFPAIALACALSMAALPALSETREDRVEAAKAYTALAMDAMDLKAMIGTMWAPVVQMIERSGKTLSEEQKDQIDALYQETFTGPMTEMMLSQSDVMADLFTLEEIEALTQFYSTPIGQSVMKKLPKVMEAIQPQIVALVQNTLPTLMPKIAAIVEKQ